MKRNESKALARIKKIYKVYPAWYYNKVSKFANWVSGETRKRCESITEFLDNVKYAKILKKTRVPYRTKMMQLEHHYENKRKRKEARKQIQEGIQEYKDQYDEYSCPCCEFYDKGFCTSKGVFVQDESICKNFRD